MLRSGLMTMNPLCFYTRKERGEKPSFCPLYGRWSKSVCYPRAKTDGHTPYTSDNVDGEGFNGKHCEEAGPACARCCLEVCACERPTVPGPYDWSPVQGKKWNKKLSFLFPLRTLDIDCGH